MTPAEIEARRRSGVRMDAVDLVNVADRNDCGEAHCPRCGGHRTAEQAVADLERRYDRLANPGARGDSDARRRFLAEQERAWRTDATKDGR